MFDNIYLVNKYILFSKCLFLPITEGFAYSISPPWNLAIIPVKSIISGKLLIFKKNCKFHVVWLNYMFL